MGIVGAHDPVLADGMLHAAGYMNGIGRFIVGIDERRWRNAVRIHSLQCRCPTALREIVIKQAKPGANHGFLAVSRRGCNPNTGGDLFAVVMRHRLRVSQSSKRAVLKGRIERLAFPGSGEQPESRLITHSVVHRQVVRNAPGVLSVKSESLNVLGKAAVTSGSKVATRTIRWRAGRALWAKVETARILRVHVRVTYILNEGLVRRRKCPSQHRFVNKVDSELERMITRSPAQVVAHLVFVLIAQRRKQSDWGSELVVAEGFEAGDGQGSRTEGKRQRETQIRITRLSKVQEAGIEHQSAEPRRTESIRIAQRYVPVVVMRGQSGGRQRCLLHQRIAREVAVFGSAQEPLRLRRLRPVKTQRTDVVTEGDGNVLGNSDRRDARNQAICG